MGQGEDTGWGGEGSRIDTGLISDRARVWREG